MKNFLLIPFFILVALIPLAFAQPQEGAPDIGGGPDMMMDRGFKHALEGLNLTGEQQQKLRDIQGGNKKEILGLMQEIQRVVLDIQEEYKKEKSDAGRINGYIDRLSNAQNRMMKLRSAQMLEMKAVLTHEQFRKLTEKLDKAKERMKKSFMNMRKKR